MEDGKWSAPKELANGVQADGSRYPCWNPVLFQPRSGALMLFYKIGPSPSKWWGVWRKSEDNGRTWSQPTRLPERIAGPIKNKPVQLKDGTILCGSSAEDFTSGPAWQIHFERSPDLGKTWESITVPLGPDAPPAIQPSILTLTDGCLQAVGRTKAGKIFSTKSKDDGRSWSELTLLDLPNPNSGTDALTLKDGRHLLVYNHTHSGRSPLNLALSTDGAHWEMVLALESEAHAEFSYPAVIQTADDLVHITYTWKRKLMKHVVVRVGD
jgi:predicted neuraminidase